MKTAVITNVVDFFQENRTNSKFTNTNAVVGGFGKIIETSTGYIMRVEDDSIIPLYDQVKDQTGLSISFTR